MLIDLEKERKSTQLLLLLSKEKKSLRSKFTIILITIKNKNRNYYMKNPDYFNRIKKQKKIVEKIDTPQITHSFFFFITFSLWFSVF